MGFLKEEKIPFAELTSDLKAKLDTFAQMGNQFEQQQQYEKAIQI